MKSIPNSTALVAVTYERGQQRVRLVTHKIFQPSPEHPLHFEGAIESTLLNWHRGFAVRSCLYDPFQMVGAAQRLTRDGVKMVEFPQTPDRLTAAAENLYELIRGRNFVSYPDEQLRAAMLHAAAIESARGWRIGKDKQSHKIDVVVALAMAALVAVREQKKRDLHSFLATGADGFGPVVEVDPVTGHVLDQPRSRLVRDERGVLHLVGCDNSAWASGERRSHAAVGLY